MYRRLHASSGLGFDNKVGPPHLLSLTSRRLLASPNERLGSGTAYAIMEHEFFKGINFKEIDQEDPPFVPELESDLDTSYFPSPEEEEDIARYTTFQHFLALTPEPG